MKALLDKVLNLLFGIQFYMDAYGNEGTPENFGLYRTRRVRRRRIERKGNC